MTGGAAYGCPACESWSLQVPHGLPMEEVEAEIRAHVVADCLGFFGKPVPALCSGCGREEGSFACRIRHVHLNTGDAKASRDFERSKP